MPNATVRANARPMPADRRAAAIASDQTAADFLSAYLDLEEQIRDLRCMASIASDLICELRLEGQGDKRTVTLSQDELDRLVFAVSKTGQMAQDLDEAYLARAHAWPDREPANV